MGFNSGFKELMLRVLFIREFLVLFPLSAINRRHMNENNKDHNRKLRLCTFFVILTYGLSWPHARVLFILSQLYLIWEGTSHIQ